GGYVRGGGLRCVVQCRETSYRHGSGQAPAAHERRQSRQRRRKETDQAPVGNFPRAISAATQVIRGIPPARIARTRRWSEAKRCDIGERSGAQGSAQGGAGRGSHGGEGDGQRCEEIEA